MTRRFWLKITAGAGIGLMARLARATDPNYTIAVVPDTQYLSLQCGAAMSNLMTWIVNNRNAAQGGVFTPDVKAVIGVGDCTHNNTGAEFTTATTAYGILTTAGIPWVNPPGNHDYYASGSSGTVRSNIGTGFTNPSGYFSAAIRGAATYGTLPGGGGTSAWGGSYDEGNYYIRLYIGARHILIFSMEHFPRTVVLNYFKGIHDANLNCEVIITTHSFMTDCGELGAFSGETGYDAQNNNDNGGQGLATSQATSDGTCNSGYSVWTNYVASWSNVSLIISGHWYYILGHTNAGATVSSWGHQQRALTSTSSRGQTVQAVFMNWQELDSGYYAGVYPGGGAPSNFQYCNSLGATYRVGHVGLLHFKPATGTMEGYALSTNTGFWEPTWANRAAALDTTPKQLFSVSYAASPTRLFPLPGTVG